MPAGLPLVDVESKIADAVHETMTGAGVKFDHARRDEGEETVTYTFFDSSAGEKGW